MLAERGSDVRFSHAWFRCAFLSMFEDLGSEMFRHLCEDHATALVRPSGTYGDKVPVATSLKTFRVRVTVRLVWPEHRMVKIRACEPQLHEHSSHTFTFADLTLQNCNKVWLRGNFVFSVLSANVKDSSAMSVNACFQIYLQAPWCGRASDRLSVRGGNKN